MDSIDLMELRGYAGDEFINGSGEITTGFFAVAILAESTVTKCEVTKEGGTAASVKVARNYGTLPANYVIWAGKNAKITSIQFSGTPSAQGFVKK